KPEGERGDGAAAQEDAIEPGSLDEAGGEGVMRAGKVHQAGFRQPAPEPTTSTLHRAPQPSTDSSPNSASALRHNTCCWSAPSTVPKPCSIASVISAPRRQVGCG